MRKRFKLLRNIITTKKEIINTSGQRTVFGRVKIHTHNAKLDIK